MVEAVVMVAFGHGPKVASKGCFESEEDSAVDGYLRSLRDRACCQQSLLLDGVAILESCLDIPRQILRIVVFIETTSNATDECCCRADV